MKKTVKDEEVLQEGIMPTQDITSKGYICRAIKVPSITDWLYPDLNGLVDITLDADKRKPNKGFFVKGLKLSSGVGALIYYANAYGQIDIRTAFRTLVDKKMFVNSIRVSDTGTVQEPVPVIYICKIDGTITMSSIV